MANPLKIGITCYPTYGGSGVVATELGMELAQRGHEVHAIDNYLRRRAHTEQDTDSLTPILGSLRERAAAWKDVTGLDVSPGDEVMTIGRQGQRRAASVADRQRLRRAGAAADRVVEVHRVRADGNLRAVIDRAQQRQLHPAELIARRASAGSALAR